LCFAYPILQGGDLWDDLKDSGGCNQANSDCLRFNSVNDGRDYARKLAEDNNRCLSNNSLDFCHGYKNGNFEALVTEVNPPRSKYAGEMLEALAQS
jgi:hypothetical protein